MYEYDIIKTYKSLCRISFLVLRNGGYTNENLENARKKFLEGFMEVIKCAYRIGTVKSNETINDLYDIEMLENTALKLENPRTYAMLNYYMSFFLVGVRLQLKPEQITEFESLLAKFAINDQKIEAVEKTYKLFLKTPNQTHH